MSHVKVPLFKSFSLGSLVLLLIACSGGGSGGNTDATSGGVTVLTGQFADSAVSGIRYVTETRSGVTDSDGQFEYMDGETVNFYIGEQFLGDAQGAALISLFNLVDGVEPLVGNALRTTIDKLNVGQPRSGKRGPNFGTVINLAILLQTLDKDGNPENGIEIPADVAALVTADSVDFNQHWENFKLDYGFRKVLAEAKSRAFLDSTRQVRKSWRAMAHLYASLGIDSKLRVSSIETTYANGGNLPTTIRRYRFDDEGKLTHSESDDDGDGATDFSTTDTYDASGNLLSHESDDTMIRARGVANYTYDIDGNMIRFVSGRDGVFTPDIRSYSYDAYGRATRVEIHVSLMNIVSINTYGADGRQTRADHDEDSDGTPDSSTIWTYSSNGYEIRRESDESGETRVSNSRSYSVDDYLLREEVDDDTDGTPDEIRIYNYDAQNNEIRFEQIGGLMSYILSRTYDANGNEVHGEFDYDKDGMPEQTYNFSYDANGNQTLFEEDHDVDGIPEKISTTTYEYDTDGNWIRREVDSNGDGTPDEIGISTYDATGNPIRRTYDYNLDGTPDLINTWEYVAEADGWWWILRGSAL